MTTEEEVLAKLAKWVVPGLRTDECFRHIPIDSADAVDFGPIMSTAAFDRATIEHRHHERWMVIELSADMLRLVDVHNPDKKDDYTMQPVPETFEELQNWVRMIDNLT